MTYRPYPNADRALRQVDRHGRTLTAVPLDKLSTPDLCTLAGRFGGPRPEELAEIARRVGEKAEALGAVFEKVRLRTAMRVASGTVEAAAQFRPVVIPAS